MNNIFCFFSLQKQVGKTISCLIFALYLIKNNFKVLLIDFDAKSDLTKYFAKGHKTDGIYKYLVNQKEYKQIIHKHIFLNIDLINASIDTAYLISTNFEQIYIDKFSYLFTQLSKEYDYILIDTSSLNNQLNQIILSNVNQIIWPIIINEYSFKQVQEQLQFINEIKKKYHIDILINGIYLNFFNQNNTLMVKYYHEIVKIFNDSLYHTSINENKELEKLKTVNEVNDCLWKTNQLKCFKKLINEFLEKNKGK